MTATSRNLAWDEGVWTNPPAAVVADGGDLLVTAEEGSDAWRTTSYGFIHDSEHALLAVLPGEAAVEVSFTADLPEQFDQAGVFLRVSPSTWIKAGLECSDGVLQLGAVVTAPFSDWSVAPVPGWSGQRVTIRASRTGDTVTVRARTSDTDFRLVRVIPLDPAVTVSAGPFVCAPTRAGLTVRFGSWVVDEPDSSLHP
ncbi:MAG: DUF1349 domain-containing protein [Propionicimonas sp.]|uniref:DUF1349 domain-containing protein n=1 Tax=Propionicimonas sp. TaxID=1955623 RepID=UPI002B1EA73C|nr:DUF1349 domain-containing protein [Propionicimonas sp.]MEA4945401.1 DUF1349 domain-containing protein [Propionicimonas sp.]